MKGCESAHDCCASRLAAFECRGPRSVRMARAWTQKLGRQRTRLPGGRTSRGGPLASDRLTRLRLCCFRLLGRPVLRREIPALVENAGFLEELDFLLVGQ